MSYGGEDDSSFEQITSTDLAPNVIQLERKEGVYCLSTATLGRPFTSIEIEDVQLHNEVFVGLYACNAALDLKETIVFSNVRIIKPAAEKFTPYVDYLGSRMEIMDIENGHRKLVFSSVHSLQAPNWIKQGKELVYNSNGFLYKYSFENKQIRQIASGFAQNNNNDHVFSFDGKLLGISHHNQEDQGDSSIYIMNPEGDQFPKKITKNGVGVSYLHGISPDNKTMIYTAYRKGKYDIYGINIETREEFQLTDTKDLDDGSEFSPDGKHIYFNSNRTGNMQLWRMKSDGGSPEQLTFDTHYKDWFPHISPDGKWVVFISFPPTIGFGEHSFYQHCTLRIMPAQGGEPKIIAYIYGGQGTINVPSWNDNSKQIAFVTNSD
ncbi:TolB family protein [Gelidibacter mesophilus]|uniref:TolB family protein n=1 Tax=Gelidibacter mesophilus TaxID=169050 RepID=UPI000422FFCC|nr:TolB family protein [Gelidibacter mesophilus]